MCYPPGKILGTPMKEEITDYHGKKFKKYGTSKNRLKRLSMFGLLRYVCTDINQIFFHRQGKLSSCLPTHFIPLCDVPSVFCSLLLLQ